MHTLISGLGKVRSTNVTRYASDFRSTIAESLNALGNGQFGNACGTSELIFTTEAQPTLNTAAGNFLTNDVSLMFKTEGTIKSYCEASTIDYAIRPMQLVNFFGRYKSVGIAAGINEFYITYTIKESFGITLKIGTKDVNTNATDWSYFMDRIIALQGATKISFRFKTARWEATLTNRLWLDEFNVNIQ